MTHHLRNGRTTTWPGILPAVLIVLPPLAWLGLATLSAFLRLGPGLFDAVSLRLLGRSLELAALSTVFALLLGGPYGWLVARYRLPARRGLLWGTLLPVALPPYCAALGWSLLLGRQGWLSQTVMQVGWTKTALSPFGSLLFAAWILAAAYWPVIAWFASMAARSVPGPLEDAARLHLPDGRAALWTARPLLFRSLAAGSLLVFLLALAEFAVPNYLGVQTYPVEIVNQFQLDREPGAVARLAFPLLSIVLPLAVAQVRLMTRSPLFGSAAGGQESPGFIRSDAAPLAAIWCLGVVASTSLVPLAVLGADSLPLSTYSDVWAESADHLGNTLLTAGAGSVLAVVLAVAFVFAARVSCRDRAGGSVPRQLAGLRKQPAPLRLEAGLNLLLTLPYALPGSLIAVAVIDLLNRPGPLGWLYTSMGGLVWLYVALFFPFALKSVEAGWARVDADLLDEGTVLGVGAWTQFRSAVWPVLRPYAAAGGCLVALLAAREGDATALLRVPDGDTIAFRIQDYLHFAPGPKIAALSVLLTLLSAALLCALLSWAWRGDPVQPAK